ncbi:hypothetical protein MTO96_012601 [Rhipicephalus appendiculatus]
MFFDCTALLGGLVASVITKWDANAQFSYGYVRAEVLAGFVNGLFLLFIAFFILSESIERVIDPPEVKHERLLLISALGLIVNIVGLVCFHTGEHSHHDHGQSTTDQQGVGRTHEDGRSHGDNTAAIHGINAIEGGSGSAPIAKKSQIMQGGNNVLERQSEDL